MSGTDETTRPRRRRSGAEYNLVRQLSGKSDTIDAEHAAREVLAGRATTMPMLADGIVEAIRLVRSPATRP